MNIPVEVARAQGEHGKKGGRPRLDLTDEERAERKERLRLQKLSSYHKRKVLLTDEEKRRRRRERWKRQALEFAAKRASLREQRERKKEDAWYVSIWGKPPGEPLTPEEYAAGELRWTNCVKAKELWEFWEVEAVVRDAERDYFQAELRKRLRKRVYGRWRWRIQTFPWNISPVEHSPEGKGTGA